MERPDYLKFSSIEGKAKENLNEEADLVHDVYVKILTAPEAAKRNLMETDFKVAVAASNRLKTLVQGESAKIAAIGNAQQAKRSNPTAWLT